MAKKDLADVKAQTTHRGESATMQGSRDPYRAVLSRERILSQLDASTGKLTGDQQRFYADLPKEEWHGQPGTRSKIVRNPDGSAEYQGLVHYGDMLVSLPNQNPTVTAAIRS